MVFEKSGWCSICRDFGVGAKAQANSEAAVSPGLSADETPDGDTGPSGLPHAHHHGARHKSEPLVRTPSKPIYQQNGSISGMRTSIDRAGRLVIPKALRDQAGITAGDVEISLDGAAIRIEGVPADELVEQDGLLLLPAGGPELDSDQVRELRLADQR